MELFFYLVAIEVIFFLFSHYIRKRNQWFILSKDRMPEFSNNVLDKVISNSYDSLLGWDRKPNTAGKEQCESGEVSWHINNDGVRNNLEFNYQESKIAIFGDSFTFSREVNDNQTWGYKLSLLSNTNVQNYGVGNHGFDQSIIKLSQKLKDKAIQPRTIVIGVVPDTVSRILSVWKHYYEYGNIYGFKPRFVLEDNKLKYIDNFINTPDKLISYQNYLQQIQKYDYFYKYKFLKEIVSFPYAINFFKNIKRNLNFSFETLKKGKINKPTSYVMKKNLECRIKLYQDINNVNLFIEQIKLLEDLSKEYLFNAYLLLMPQKDDFNYIQNSQNHFYKTLIDRIPENIICIDIYKYLKNYSSSEIDSFYSEDSDYGGHFSPKGNSLIADIVFKIINQSETK